MADAFSGYRIRVNDTDVAFCRSAMGVASTLKNDLGELGVNPGDSVQVVCWATGPEHSTVESVLLKGLGQSAGESYCRFGLW